MPIRKLTTELHDDGGFFHFEIMGRRYQLVYKNRHCEDVISYVHIEMILECLDHFNEFLNKFCLI